MSDHANEAADLAQAVIHELQRRADPATRSPSWPGVLDAINTDPRPFARALGLPTGAPSWGQAGVFIVTRAWMDMHRTARGGWTAAQLRAIGDSWPPVRGWAARAVGRVITDDARQAFEAAK